MNKVNKIYLCFLGSKRCIILRYPSHFLYFFVAASSTRIKFSKVTIPKFGETGDIIWVLQAKFVSLLDENVYNVGNQYRKSF